MAANTDVTEYGTQNPEMEYYPVSKNDPNYKMDHKRTGKALIFNFERWVSRTYT